MATSWEFQGYDNRILVLWSCSGSLVAEYFVSHIAGMLQFPIKWTLNSMM
jgi:hypothetical protein